MQDECCYVFPQSQLFFFLSFWCLVSYVAMGFATTSLLSLHEAVPYATKGSAVVAVSVFWWRTSRPCVHEGAGMIP